MRRNFQSPTNVMIVESTTIRWAVHVARMRETKMHTSFWCRNLVKNAYLENRERDGRITLG
jgi:hypothetical protein